MKILSNLGTLVAKAIQLPVTVCSNWELQPFVLSYQLGDMQNQAFIVLSCADTGGL